MGSLRNVILSCCKKQFMPGTSACGVRAVVSTLVGEGVDSLVFFNLAFYGIEQGHRVLCVDLDPQKNFSKTLRAFRERNLGVLQVTASDTESFDGHDLRFLTGVARVAASAWATCSAYWVRVSAWAARSLDSRTSLRPADASAPTVMSAQIQPGRMSNSLVMRSSVRIRPSVPAR